MHLKFNIQYIISYFGILPYIFIIIDKYYFFQIKEDFIINFFIYYTLIIFTFIGSINWNLHVKLKNHIVIYGFLPSLMSVIIIILNLLKYNTSNIIVIIIILISLQLFLDYLLIYSNRLRKEPYYFIRVPLTLIIIIILLLSIF